MTFNISVGVMCLLAAPASRLRNKGMSVEKKHLYQRRTFWGTNENTLKLTRVHLSLLEITGTGTRKNSYRYRYGTKFY
jgi:hypothetical protein